MLLTYLKHEVLINDADIAPFEADFLVFRVFNEPHDLEPLRDGKKSMVSITRQDPVETGSRLSSLMRITLVYKIHYLSMDFHGTYRQVNVRGQMKKRVHENSL